VLDTDCRIVTGTGSVVCSAVDGDAIPYNYSYCKMGVSRHPQVLPLPVISPSSSGEHDSADRKITDKLKGSHKDKSTPEIGSTAKPTNDWGATDEFDPDTATVPGQSEAEPQSQSQTRTQNQSLTSTSQGGYGGENDLTSGNTNQVGNQAVGASEGAAAYQALRPRETGHQGLGTSGGQAGYQGLDARDGQTGH
jgi:hypothetical protein